MSNLGKQYRGMCLLVYSKGNIPEVFYSLYVPLATHHELCLAHLQYSATHINVRFLNRHINLLQV